MADTSVQAEALKNDGNALFKAGNYHRAAEKYAQAQGLSPQMAEYSGNLSAALTEDGRYLEAIEAIVQAKEIIRQQVPAVDLSAYKLLQKLSNRLARCLYHAVHTNILPEKFVLEHEALITSLRDIETPAGSIRWWDRYDRVYFDSLPVRKSAFLTEGILDSWGIFGPEATCPGDSNFRLSDIPVEDQRNLSFLFGGVGDDIHSQKPAAHVKVHLALVDVQPWALARDLVVLLIIWNTLRLKDYEFTVLSAKTAFYIFCDAIMPPDSRALVTQTCLGLKCALDGTGSKLPAIIAVDPRLAPMIIDCIEYWMDLPSSISVSAILKHVEVGPAPQTTNICIVREHVVYSTLKVLLPPYIIEDLGTTFKQPITEWSTVPRILWNMHVNISSGIGNRNPLYLFNPSLQVIKAVDTLHTRVDGNGTTDPRWPSFSKFTSILFMPMTRALEALESRVKFEFFAGDVVRFLALKTGSPSLDWRVGFPTSFTRAWMSIVPDYSGGLLEMALYAVPCLQTSNRASVGMNCLFNGAAWNNNFNDFVYTTFIQLLLRVIEVGYPSTWIVELLHHILHKTLHSSCRPYSDAPMPAHTIDKKYPSANMQLSPWMADIEVVVASAIPLLPPGLDLPPSFPLVGDTAIFRSRAKNIFRGQSYARNPGLALLFVAPEMNPPTVGFTTRNLLFSKMAGGCYVQIVFSIMKFDVDLSTRTGTVSWRMHIPRVARMKEAGWVLYLWEADVPFIVPDRGHPNGKERKLCVPQIAASYIKNFWFTICRILSSSRWLGIQTGRLFSTITNKTNLAKKRPQPSPTAPVSQLGELIVYPNSPSMSFSKHPQLRHDYHLVPSHRHYSMRHRSLAFWNRQHFRPRPCDVGNVHVAFTVENINEMLAALLDAGCVTHGKPRGPPGQELVYFHDLDGAHTATTKIPENADIGTQERKEGSLIGICHRMRAIPALVRTIAGQPKLNLKSHQVVSDASEAGSKRTIREQQHSFPSQT
ncbi:hypothetical protein B0H10DRAFT_1956475 [Mycena sp. CBHHK59/15]|nr:hypothetical protein B0H10DRAFT_1956475 [Mycena sp. CBHHK59/15]